MERRRALLVGRLRARLDTRFPGFTLRPTRAFWAWIAAVPVLGLAALNTGNNALYLLLAVTLGAFVASGWLSRHTLRHVSAELEPPGEVFCGSAARVAVRVRNSSSWLPAAGVACRLVGLPGSVVLPVVPPGGDARVTLMTIFPRRGVVPLPAVRVDVCLPLPFFVKSSRFAQAGEALVYPRRFPAGPPHWAEVAQVEVQSVAGSQRRRGDVELLREFRPGDDRRDVHWKQTARQQRVIVMERRERALPSRYLVLDRQLPRLDDELLQERFEDLVSEVASAAVEQLRRGEAVGLVVGSRVTVPATGASQTRRILRQLALVRPGGPGEDPLPAAVGGQIYRLVGGA